MGASYDDKRIGFETPGENLVPSVMYPELAEFVVRNVSHLGYETKMRTRDGSRVIAPNIEALISQDATMVEVLERSGIYTPKKKKIVGVGIAIPEDIYDPANGDPNIAINHTFALEKIKGFSRSQRFDSADLLAALRHRVMVKRFSGGLVVMPPVFTSLNKHQVRKYLS